MGRSLFGGLEGWMSQDWMCTATCWTPSDKSVHGFFNALLFVCVIVRYTVLDYGAEVWGFPAYTTFQIHTINS